MKAISYERYGSPDVLKLVDIPVPTITDDEILVVVKAASVNPLDYHYLRGTPYIVRLSAGFGKPKNTGLGADLAGVVESVGANITGFAKGDEVYGQSLRTFAEFASVSIKAIIPKPQSLSFEQAAAVPIAGFTALQGLRDSGHVQSGQTVLINGAAGGVGTFAVQLAKWMGATVTGVCSTPNVELVKSLGATDVIDYTTTDFAASGRHWDMIFDLAGFRSLSDLRRVLAPNGVLVSSSAPKGDGLEMFARPIAGAILSPFTKQRLVTLGAKRSMDDLSILSGLIEAGTVKPVIDRSYPLSQTADALRYLELGHARGKVVITV
jgi:NADPH:quinone reductase-like Zn-dependent oxidoreductase